MRGPRLDTACFTPALPMLGPVGPKSTRGFLRGPALPQHGLEQLAHLAGIFRRLDPAFLHHCELFLRRALAAGDDGTGVAHALAGRRGDAGNETDHGFFHVGLDPARGVLFIGPADLAHHDHRVGLGIVVEQLQHLDMLHAVHRVAADAHARGLAKPQLHQLADRFVSERARARHHADAALLVDVAGHDADLDLVGRDQAGAVRPDELGALALHLVLGANHVAHRDAFGDADDEVQIGLDRLVDRGGCEGRRHVDHRDVGAGLLLRFLHRREDRDALVALTWLFRIHTGDIAVPPVRVLLAHLGVELAGLAGDALGHHPGVLVYGWPSASSLLLRRFLFLFSHRFFRRFLLCLGFRGRLALWFRLGLGLRLRPAAGGGDDLLSGVGHVVGRDDRQSRVGEDLLAQIDVGPLQAHHQRHPQAHLLRRRHHARRDHVALHDAAEDVDEDRLQVRNAQHDLEGLGDLLGGRAAADVEEVRGRPAVELGDVHGGHREPRAVHQAADVAVELDVVEVVLRRLDFGGVFLVEVAQLLPLGMAEARVVVEVDLGVERHYFALAGEDEGVDLGEAAVGFVEGPVQALEDRARLWNARLGNADLLRETVGLGILQARARIDEHRVDLPGRLCRDFLDVHAAFAGGHERDALRAAVDHHADVELLLDVGAFFDQEPPHFLSFGSGLVGLQHHAEDFAGPFAHFALGFHHLHAAALRTE